MTGAVGLSISISFAALIFSGELKNYVGTGVGIVLFSGIVLHIIIACFSSFPGMIADIEPLGTAILATIVANIASAMSSEATPEELLLTVVAAMALTSLLTGAFLFALGLFKIGNLTRFTPYPVLGGFLAGTGWLLVAGSIEMMANTTLSWQEPAVIFQTNIFQQWIAALIFAVVVFALERYYDRVWILPTSLIAAIVLFYGWLFLADISITEAGSQGLLLGPFPDKSLWQPLDFRTLTQVNWSAIFQPEQINQILSIMLVTAPNILLTSSALELMADRDIDLNQELKAAGIANLASGLGGGMVGLQILPDTVLSYRMGGKSRLVGLLMAILYSAVLLLGHHLLSYFPKVVLGGLLILLGLSFLVEWIYDAWFKLPKLDYAIVVAIAIALFLGFCKE